MEQQIVAYIKKHTFLMTMLVISGFIILGVGEYYLYRQQMYLNKMISEGFMQLKEAQNQATLEKEVMEELPQPSISVTVQK